MNRKLLTTLCLLMTAAGCSGLGDGPKEGAGSQDQPLSCPPIFDAAVTGRDSLDGHPNFTHLHWEWQVTFDDGFLKEVQDMPCEFAGVEDTDSGVISCGNLHYTCGGCRFTVAHPDHSPTSVIVKGLEFQETKTERYVGDDGKTYPASRLRDEHLADFPDATECIHYNELNLNSSSSQSCTPNCVTASGDSYMRMSCGADDGCGGVCSGREGVCEQDGYFCNGSAQCEEVREDDSGGSYGCDSPNAASCLSSCGASTSCVEVCCD